MSEYLSGLLYSDLFHRKAQAGYNLQIFTLVAQFSQCVLPVEGWGKYAVRPVTPFHTTHGHMVLFFIFVFCWQTLKGVLIRGLLILLRRSIQPSAQKRVTSLAAVYGSCGATAACAAVITRLDCCNSLQ